MSGRITILLVLFFSSLAWSANDFTGDSDCYALWRLESGALTTDTIGSNTWTNSGVAEDTSNYREGACAGDVETADQMTIADGSLDAGFPLKNGDTNKKISVCLWIRPDAVPGSYGEFSIWAKGRSSDSTREFDVTISRVDGGVTRVGMRIGYNYGAASEYKLSTSPTVATGQWYHMGVTFDDSTKAWCIRTYDYSAATAYTASGTTTNNVNVEAGTVYLNPYTNVDGRVDEIVVFDDILSTAEIDSIRSGTYGASSGGSSRRIISGANGG